MSSRTSTQNSNSFMHGPLDPGKQSGQSGPDVAPKDVAAIVVVIVDAAIVIVGVKVDAAIVVDIVDVAVRTYVASVDVLTVWVQSRNMWQNPAPVCTKVLQSL